MTQTVSRKYKWGKLRIKADFAQASSQILYAYADDEPGSWRNTPYQVADARHNAVRALSLVNRWLASQVG